MSISIFIELKLQQSNIQNTYASQKNGEPAMSEFKVGDWVKRTDKITESIYQISSIDKDLIKCNFIKNGENWRLHTTKGEIEYATPEEIAAGHRIDKPSNSGELETLDHEENHISPNCQSKDV